MAIQTCKNCFLNTSENDPRCEKCIELFPEYELFVFWTEDEIFEPWKNLFLDKKDWILFQ